MILPALSLLTRYSAHIKRLGIAAAIVIATWSLFFHWTGTHQVAITRNVFTGELVLDNVPGIDVSWPWVQVSRIDIRPHRLCIDCDCRALNCRLVEFDESGWLDFVNREGFKYYWWSNRFSYNSGAKQEYRGMAFILRGYMSDGQPHPFLKITKE